MKSWRALFIKSTAGGLLWKIFRQFFFFLVDDRPPRAIFGIPPEAGLA